MRRVAALSLVVHCLLLVPASAQSFDYDFSGLLSDHFAPAFPNPNSSLTQNLLSEQLEYFTPGGRLHGDNGTGLVHRQFQPRNDQSWWAAVDVGLPAGYDSSFLTDNPANQNPNGDTWLEVGIIGIADIAADQLFTLSLALELDSLNQVQRIVLATDESTGTDGQVATVDVNTRLMLQFDAISEQLTALADNVPIFSIDLGPSGVDWQMADDDVFSIALFGSTGHQDVSVSEPLTIDNFSAAVIVPELSTLALAGFALACMPRRFALSIAPRST